MKRGIRVPPLELEMSIRASQSTVPRQPHRFTSVSVVMPIRNEATTVEAALRAVLEQDYPEDRYEVVIALAPSTDGTAGIVRAIVAEYGRRTIRILKNSTGTTPKGLNACISVAQGDLIARVDGHSVIPRDYLRRCTEVLDLTGADSVGACQRATGRGIVGEVIARATSSPFGVGNARHRYGRRPGWVKTAYLGVYRRSVFSEIGLFDEELIRNQDDELNLRLVQQRGRIWFEPEIEVRYMCRSRLRDLWHQYFDYGLHKVLVVQKRGTVASLRHLVPPAFVGALVAASALSLHSWNLRPLVVLLLPYLTATGLASVRAGGCRLQTTALMPAAFITLHVAWGCGALAGVWRWRHSLLPFRKTLRLRAPWNRAS